MESDRERWDHRYEDAVCATPHPPEVLSLWPELDASLSSTGRAVDLACGTGAQSLWLAQRGLDVVALDVSPRAVALLDEAAAAAGVGHRIEARVIDTDDGLPRDVSDAAIIVCQRYRAPALYQDLVARLAPGGHLCLTVLSAVGLDGDAGPFHAPAGELATAFATTVGADLVHEAEGDGLASVVVRRRRD